MNPENDISPPATCTTGSCGGPGLCPGITLFTAYAVGGGLALLTGFHWLGWAVGVPLALILITGAWRFLPMKAKWSPIPVMETTRYQTPLP